MEDTNQTLQELERKFWQSLVDQDFKAAEALLGNPALMVNTHGCRKYQHPGYRQMAEDGSMTLKSFVLSDMDILRPTDSTAILAYDVKQVIAHDGEDVGEEQQMHDTSTWIRMGNQWKCVAHTETPVGTPH